MWLSRYLKNRKYRKYALKNIKYNYNIIIKHLEINNIKIV